MTRKRPVSGLYAVTPDDAEITSGAGLQDLIARTADVLRGGARVLQYRSKSSDARRRLHMAESLAALCLRHGTLFLVNDDVELARSCGAHGVHLGRDDRSLAAARDRLGPDAVIGASCYDELERGTEALRAGADYLAFGSMFQSRVKPRAVRAPLDLLAAARERFGLPVVAIGGINLDNAAQVVRAGADAVAVVSAVYDAPDPFAAAKRFASLFNLSSAPLPEAL